jgi:hypothetical protein
VAGYNRCLSTAPPIEPCSREDRLESWKEIASYLNRSEPTVRRWEEKEGLPIHRLQHDKRGSVYAYGSELDRWRESRTQLLTAEPAGGVSLDWLERASDERHVGYYLPSIDPVYDPLRSNPRFIALMQRMNLAGR